MALIHLLGRITGWQSWNKSLSPRENKPEMPLQRDHFISQYRPGLPLVLQEAFVGGLWGPRPASAGSTHWEGFAVDPFGRGAGLMAMTAVKDPGVEPTHAPPPLSAKPPQDLEPPPPNRRERMSSVFEHIQDFKSSIIYLVSFVINAVTSGVFEKIFAGLGVQVLGKIITNPWTVAVPFVFEGLRKYFKHYRSFHTFQKQIMGNDRAQAESALARLSRSRSRKAVQVLSHVRELSLREGQPKPWHVEIENAFMTNPTVRKLLAVLENEPASLAQRQRAIATLTAIGGSYITDQLTGYYMRTSNLELRENLEFYLFRLRFVDWVTVGHRLLSDVRGADQTQHVRLMSHDWGLQWVSALLESNPDQPRLWWYLAKSFEAKGRSEECSVGLGESESV